jgi:hypothetical protein
MPDYPCHGSTARSIPEIIKNPEDFLAFGHRNIFASGLKAASGDIVSLVPLSGTQKIPPNSKWIAFDHHSTVGRPSRNGGCRALYPSLPFLKIPESGKNEQRLACTTCTDRAGFRKTSAEFLHPAS